MASKATPSTLASEASKPHGYPFEWAGEKWTLRPQFDVRTLAALKRGEFDLVLRFLLGADEADRIMSVDSDEALDLAVLMDMIQTTMSHSGMELGESQASPR